MLWEYVFGRCDGVEQGVCVCQSFEEYCIFHTTLQLLQRRNDETSLCYFLCSILHTLLEKLLPLPLLQLVTAWYENNLMQKITDDVLQNFKERSRAKRRLRVSFRDDCLSSKPRKTGSSFNPEITKFHREVRTYHVLEFSWDRGIEGATYGDEIPSFSSHQCFRLFSR